MKCVAWCPNTAFTRSCLLLTHKDIAVEQVWGQASERKTTELLSEEPDKYHGYVPRYDCGAGGQVDHRGRQRRLPQQDPPVIHFWHGEDGQLARKGRLLLNGVLPEGQQRSVIIHQLSKVEIAAPLFYQVQGSGAECPYHPIRPTSSLLRSTSGYTILLSRKCPQKLMSGKPSGSLSWRSILGGDNSTAEYH